MCAGTRPLMPVPAGALPLGRWRRLIHARGLLVRCEGPEWGPARAWGGRRRLKHACLRACIARLCPLVSAYSLCLCAAEAPRLWCPGMACCVCCCRTRGPGRQPHSLARRALPHSLARLARRRVRRRAGGRARSGGMHRAAGGSSSACAMHACCVAAAIAACARRGLVPESVRVFASWICVRVRVPRGRAAQTRRGRALAAWREPDGGSKAFVHHLYAMHTSHQTNGHVSFLRRALQAGLLPPAALGSARRRLCAPRCGCAAPLFGRAHAAGARCQRDRAACGQTHSFTLLYDGPKGRRLPAKAGAPLAAPPRIILCGDCALLCAYASELQPARAGTPQRDCAAKRGASASLLVD
jgi:hypothetical protein